MPLQCGTGDGRSARGYRVEPTIPGPALQGHRPCSSSAATRSRSMPRNVGPGMVGSTRYPPCRLRLGDRAGASGVVPCDLVASAGSKKHRRWLLPRRRSTGASEGGLTDDERARAGLQTSGSDAIDALGRHLEAKGTCVSQMGFSAYPGEP